MKNSGYNKRKHVDTAAASDETTGSTIAKKKVAKSASDTTATTTSSTKEEKCPRDLLLEKIDAFVKDNNLEGYVFARGITRNKAKKADENNDDDERDCDDDDDDSDDEDYDETKYTTEEMNTARFIMLDTKRNQTLTLVRHLILGDQANSMILSFNTSFSHKVSGTFYKFVKPTVQRRNQDPANKLNFLFAFTFLIKEHDTWMSDNEGGMEKMVKDLASLWKKLLTKKNTNQALGIDSEYTRAGIMAMLEDFKEEVEDEESFEDVPFKFNYK